MIYGVGTDIVNIERIAKMVQKHGERFLTRCFTPQERQVCEARGEERRIPSYAKLYAAKEAILKASGYGMREGVSWHDIDIGHTEHGKPTVRLTGGLEQFINSDRGCGSSKMSDKTIQIDLSLSDDMPFAVAFAVISIK